MLMKFVSPASLLCVFALMENGATSRPPLLKTSELLIGLWMFASVTTLNFNDGGVIVVPMKSW